MIGDISVTCGSALFFVLQWLAKELSQHHTTAQHHLAASDSLRLTRSKVNFEGPPQRDRSDGTVAKSKRSETKLPYL